MIGTGGLDKTTLNWIVHGLARDARLTGEFCFMSLRSGFVRTAVRAGVPDPLILSQAGFRTMQGLLRHSRREHLVRDSIAGRVGL